MKLTSNKRIISNDYPQEDQKLVEKLAENINTSVGELYFALSGRLDFANNFACTVKDFEVTLSADGTPINRTSILLNNGNPVKGCIIISVQNRTNAASYPSGSPFVSYTQSANSLFIDHITGLQPNNRYLITLIALN